MAGLHGGARPGAGRKPKSNAQVTPGTYEDPLAYLLAVATGREPADGLRIAAAKACLPWTRPKERAPVESPAPREIARKARQGIAADEHAAWEAKAAEIRRKHAARKGTDG